MKFGDFRDLDVWKQCRGIRLKIFKETRNLPTHEKYDLVSQMVRASRSATACIAEGYGRYHYQETIQFCRQSRGSLYELIDHLTAAEDSGYFTENTVKDMVLEIKKTIKILNGYIRYLQQQKKIGT
ncbi:MAG: four helix bundle protein [Desulfobulbaceae bacterium]|uniref:Four helix bundle protein n=1 Tax=Candidatus Desulfobia pelagia TaxID=2841692 RepID=A0A8J6TBA3_9BACT|nr:four helix bundle protein [Candidatus Desulfobia pelagia]